MLLVSCEKNTENQEQEKIKGISIHRFLIDVSTSDVGGDESSNRDGDWGMLLLPKRDPDKPVRLVIYCHSGGGITSATKSEAENIDFVKYFVSKGYAVLDMCGMPRAYAERIRVDFGRTVGSHVSLRAMVNGYKFVTENFNIAKDGCFVFSNSNGGLLACNLVNLTNLPILAQSGLAPLISTGKNGWYVPSGPVHLREFTIYQNRANISRIFGMKVINNQTDLINAQYEKEKVGVYDPFDYCINQTDKPYRTPYLILTFKNDRMIFYDIAKEFSDKMNARGSKIIINDIEEYGGHNVAANPIIVGSFDFLNENIPLKLTVKTVGDFFDLYNPSLKNGEQ